MLRFARPACLPLALALLAVGCTAPPPTTVPDPAASAVGPFGPPPTPTPVAGTPVPQLQTPGPSPAPTPALANLAGTVFAPDGSSPIPQTFISTNGATFISTNGATFISTNGATYRTQALGGTPTANVEVALTTLQPDGRLQSVPGRPSVRSDAAGNYLFTDVPADNTYVVMGILKNRRGKPGVLLNVGAAGKADVPLSAASTIVTASAIRRGAIPTDLAAFAAAVKAVDDKVTASQLPSFEAIDEVAAFGEKLAKDVPALKAVLDQATADQKAGGAGTVTTVPSPTPTPRRGSGGGGSNSVSPPAAPPIPLISNQGAVTATVKWNSVSGATGYNVYVDNVLKVSNTTKLIALIGGLAQNSSADIEVTALNAGGESARSPLATATTVLEGTAAWTTAETSDDNSTPAIDVDGPESKIIYAAHDGVQNKLYGLKQDGSQSFEEFYQSAQTAAPAVQGGNVFFGTTAAGNAVFSLTTALATFNWSFNTGGAVQAGPAIASDGTIYASRSGGPLYAINPDGTQKWQLSGLASTSFTSPVVASNGNVLAFADNKLYCFEPAAGAQQWVSADTFADPTDMALASDGTIYFGDGDDIHAVNPTTGATTWTFNTDAPVTSAPATGTDGTIYIGVDTLGTDQGLLALNPGGTLKWIHNVGAVNAPVVVGADGVIYFATSGAAYGVADGGTSATARWSLAAGTGIGRSSGLALDKNGRLYLKGSTGLMAISTTSEGLAASSWPKVHKDGRNTGRF